MKKILPIHIVFIGIALFLVYCVFVFESKMKDPTNVTVVKDHYTEELYIYKNDTLQRKTNPCIEKPDWRDHWMVDTSEMKFYTSPNNIKK